MTHSIWTGCGRRYFIPSQVLVQFSPLRVEAMYEKSTSEIHPSHGKHFQTCKKTSGRMLPTKLVRGVSPEIADSDRLMTKPLNNPRAFV